MARNEVKKETAKTVPLEEDKMAQENNCITRGSISDILRTETFK